MHPKPLSKSPSLSVVVISRNEGLNLRRTVENFEDTTDGNTDIVVVDDGSTDGSADHLARRRRRVRLIRAKGLGVTRARNLGARQTRGDILIFADAHMQMPALWWRPMVEHLARPEIGAVSPVITDVGGTSLRGYGLNFRGPHMEIKWLKGSRDEPTYPPILPGCCLGMRRDVFLKTGGWDEGLLHRGNVDNELSVRLWLLGYELVVTPEVVVGHLFRRRSPYRTGWPEYLHNRLRLACVHLNPERVAKVVAALQSYSFIGQALLLIAEGDSAARRREMRARRVRDDDWFFARFGLNW